MDERSAVTMAQAAASVIESLVYVHGGDLSPCGTRVVVTRSMIRGDTEVFELAEHDLTDGGVRSIGHGQAPTWSPDGNTVAFLHEDESGTTQIFTWSATEGGTEARTSLVQGVMGSMVWSPDGSALAFLAVRPPIDRSVPYRVTRTVGWRDGFGLVDDSATQIWVLDMATSTTRALTDDGCVNVAPTWLAHTGEIAYIATMQPDDWSDMNVVRAVSLTGAVRDILHTLDVTSIADVAPEIGQLVMSAGGKFHDTPGELLVVHHDGSLESRTSQLGLDVIGDILGDLPVPFADLDARILVSGDSAVVRVQRNDCLDIHRVALRGPQSNQLLAASDGCLYPLTLAGTQLLHASGTARSVPDLWVRDLATGHEQQVTAVADENRPKLRPVNLDTEWVRAPGGPDVHVKFMRPADAVGPSATVLLIHGGPYTAWGEAYNSDAQLLCEAGFGVLLVNPRGSRGYGSAFASAIDGDWGNVDYLDVMASVDLAIERGWTDPDRLGVAGVSYGGFMTAWIISHTNRFSAAVCENGVTNFVSMYGTSDVGLSYLPEALGGTPYERFETYVRCSPITTAHTAVTPTLVISGDSDHRCPPEQSRQLYAVLKRAGCHTEFLVLPDSSHVGSIYGSIAVRRAQNEALVEWMARHV